MSFPAIRKLSYYVLELFLPFHIRWVKKTKFALLSPIHKNYIQFSPTYDCQCNCLHCGMSKYAITGEKLSQQEIKDIIDNLVSLGFGQIDFFGGEPLLDNHIFDYISHASQKGIFTHINTNGILLSQENVDKLASTGLSAISISFDSFEDQKHDRNRGIDGAFHKAMDGAQRCIRKNIRTIMSVYATENEMANGNTQKLITLAKEKGFYRVRFLNSFKTGQLSNENVKTYHDKSMILDEILSDKTFVKPHGVLKCFIPFHSTVYISPFGDIQPCSMVPITFGNIRNESLKTILMRLRNHPLANIKTTGCIMNSDYMKRNFFDKVDLNSEKLPIEVSQLAFPQETS